MKGAEKTATEVVARIDNDFIVVSSIEDFSRLRVLALARKNPGARTMLRRVGFLFGAGALALSAQAAGLQEAVSVRKALLVHAERTELPPIHAIEAPPHSGILKQLHRLPAAIGQFKPASLWQERPGLILGILAVVAMQSALIAGLLVNRATRRRAERALAESGERIGLAMESANLGLWIWDIVRDEFWAMARFRSMFGFRADERITFAVFLERVHPDDREAMERQVRRALDEGQTYESEYRLALPNGGTPWIAAAGRVEFAASGAASRMHGVCREITERRQAQLETQRLQHEIAHVGRVSMMGQLASSLAHEIIQPLSAILRNAEAAELFMQSKTPDLEEIRAILADIRTDDQRAGSVIDRMRTLLKRHVLDTRRLDLTELVGNVADLARPEAATRRVKLTVNLPADLPSVRGDRVHLQQVLLNLILNGMDSLNGAKRESRSVTVSARVDGARTVEIAVSDTGAGVAAEKLAHVFDPFFTTKPDGMGMGLPISRTIVESHGGRLWAENNDGTGATFRFTLPPAEEARDDGGKRLSGIAALA